MSGLQWDESQRYWEDRHKHKPWPQRISWRKQVKQTKHDDAKYAPGVDIEELEMRCVAEGQELPRDIRPTVRRFFLDTGETIGASEGEETTVVYVEWGNDGRVHGRPITKRELRRKGARGI